MSDKFMFFENFKTTADKLPDDLRLKFYDALTDYAFSGKEPEDAVIAALVNALKPSLDKIDGRVNNGGNHNPKGTNQHKVESKEVNSGQFEVNSGQFRSIPLETETETETEKKEKDTLKGIQKEKPENKKFIKPTLAEVQAYCRERQNNVDAERWLDYYEANGWKVGKNPMKDWRAAVRTWERGTVAGGGTNTEKRDENGLREIVW